MTTQVPSFDEQSQLFNPIRSASHTENLNRSHHHNSLSVRDDQVNDLMSSIQNKLSMLVCEDSLEGSDFETSKLASPQREYLTATDEKKNYRAKMTLQDLSTSQYRKQKNNNHQKILLEPTTQSKLRESRVVNRINEMEEFYIQKIQALSSRMASFEFDYEQLQKQHVEVVEENRKLKRIIEQRQIQDKEQISRKVKEIKKEMIRKLSEESQQHFEVHIKEMKELNDQLMSERAKRRYQDQEIQLLKNEKKNLEEFYRGILNDHRNMIRIDLQKAESSQKQPSEMSSFKEDGRKGVKSPESATIRKKTKKKSKGTDTRRSEHMSKEQMIPFLAKGIQELKDKLHLN